MRNEDLKAGHDLSERDRAIAHPVPHRLGIVDEDDEVVVFALEVDF